MQDVHSSSIHEQRVFDTHHRMLSFGILLGVTLVAFEALAVVTIAPRFTASLGGVALYGWVFSGFLLTSLLGTVMSGQLADSGSLGRPLVGGLSLFAFGLLVSGFAPSMLVLIIGRLLQGLGGGALITVMYTAINRAYPDSLRARIMALTSSAWIVPALLGPAVAGLVAEALHWRLVFWGIVPLLVLVGALTIPTFNRLRPQSASRTGQRRLPAALVLAFGAGLFLIGLGGQALWLAVPLVCLGATLAVLGLRTLLPEGTLRLQSGLPAVVAARGSFFAAFVGVEAFLALMLTSVHGFSSTVTGGVIASGSISWAVGAWLQSRLDERYSDKRPLRMVIGTGLMILGIVLQVLALFSSQFPLGIVVVGWIMAGLGIGMAHATSSVLAFAYAPAGQEGRVSSALNIADQFTAAVSTGVGGALLALATRLQLAEQLGIFFALGFCLMLVSLGFAAAWRVAPQ